METTEIIWFDRMDTRNSSYLNKNRRHILRFLFFKPVFFLNIKVNVNI